MIKVSFRRVQTPCIKVDAYLRSSFLNTTISQANLFYGILHERSFGILQERFYGIVAENLLKKA